MENDREMIETYRNLQETYRKYKKHIEIYKKNIEIYRKDIEIYDHDKAQDLYRGAGMNLEEIKEYRDAACKGNNYII